MSLEFCPSCCRSKYLTCWVNIQLVASSLNSVCFGNLLQQDTLLFLLFTLNIAHLLTCLHFLYKVYTFCVRFNATQDYSVVQLRKQMLVHTLFIFKINSKKLMDHQVCAVGRVTWFFCMNICLETNHLTALLGWLNVLLEQINFSPNIGDHILSKGVFSSLPSPFSLSMLHICDQACKMGACGHKLYHGSQISTCAVSLVTTLRTQHIVSKYPQVVYFVLVDQYSSPVPHLLNQPA